MRVLIYGFTGNVLGGIEVYTLNMSEYMSDDCVFDYIVDGDECAYRERITKRGGKYFCSLGKKTSSWVYKQIVAYFW